MRASTRRTTLRWRIGLGVLVLGLALRANAGTAHKHPRRTAPPRAAVTEPSRAPAAQTRGQAVLVDWVMESSPRPMSRGLATLIVHTTFEHSEAHGVDPIMMLALISVESQFNPRARSRAGAVGLTQIIPRWHPEKIKPRQALDPVANIRVGVEILDEYTRQHRGNLNRALAQYNGSSGARYAARVRAERSRIRTFTRRATARPL